MSSFEAIQIEFIQWIQQAHSPALDAFFTGASYLGEEWAFLIALPFLWLAVDWKLAARLASLLLVSFYFNSLFKDWLAQPRPFEVGAVLKLYPADDHGIPSGHAQSSLVFWLFLVRATSSRAVRVAAILLIPLIAFSRIYLGVHFPTDILGGWVLGAILFGIFVFAEEGIEQGFARLPVAAALGIAVAGPLLLALVHPSGTVVAAMGALAGLGSGTILLARSGGFDSGGTTGDRALRVAIGLILLVAIYFGLSRALPGKESSFAQEARFFRYGAIGLWVSFGMPWLWRRSSGLLLAPREQD